MPEPRRALRQRRTMLGYTQRSLAEKVKVDRTSVIRWERGEKTPSPLIRIRLADALRLTTDELHMLLFPVRPDQPFLPPTQHPAAISAAASRKAAPAPNRHHVAANARPSTWHVHAMTYALLTDSSGNVLFVRPYYQRRWTLPGGPVATGEHPHTAIARMLTEDLSWTGRVGRMLAVGCAPATDSRPFVTSLLFDVGPVSRTDIRLTAADLHDAAFIGPAQASTFLDAVTQAHLDAGMQARRYSTTIYLPDTHQLG